MGVDNLHHVWIDPGSTGRISLIHLRIFEDTRNHFLSIELHTKTYHLLYSGILREFHGGLARCSLKLSIFDPNQAKLEFANAHLLIS